MIQIIINTEVDVRVLWRAEEQTLFSHQPSPIQEMIEGSWLLILNEKDEFDAIEQAIEALGDVKIIGTYNMDGTQYEWMQNNRNHTIEKYHNKLRPKQIRNEQTDDYDEVPYTEAEAVDVQVNLIYGHPNRILN